MACGFLDCGMSVSQSQIFRPSFLCEFSLCAAEVSVPSAWGVCRRMIGTEVYFGFVSV